MIRLPDPEKYDDPIKYFRDSHKIIANVVARFFSLIDAAGTKGVSFLLEKKDEWSELLEFFVRGGPIHEQDEARALFPVILEKVPHLGFQSPKEPYRFILEEHEVMQQRARALLAIWKGYLVQQSLSADDEKRFFDVSDELVKLYHEHIGMEDKIIYTAANDNLLTPAERIGIMLLIREMHSERTVTPVIGFESTIYDSASEDEDDSAISKNVIDVEEEPDDEDE